MNNAERVFYGWYIAAGVGATAFAAWGIGFYQLGVFAQALSEQHNWSISLLAAGATLFYVIVGLSSIVTGRLVDRYGPRNVLISGAFILGAGIFFLGRAETLWQVYVADSILAVGFASTSTLVLGAVIGRWFIRRRAFVMTLALSGAPLGAFVFVPVSSLLIHHYGLPTGSALLAIIAVAIVLPTAIFVVKDDPIDSGWEPDGDRHSSHPELPKVGPNWTLRSAIQTPAWWLLTISFAAIMFCQVAYLVHQVNFLSPIVGSGKAAGIVSITGAAGVAGRFFGGLGDHFPTRYLMGIYCLAQSIAVLLAAFSTTPLILMLSAALIGFTMGNTVALQPVLMAERFGMRSYGAVFGATSMITQFGAAIGLSFVGILAVQTGSYTIPFVMTGLLALVAATSAVISDWRPTYLETRQHNAIAD